jgi:hypothetical protein
MPEVDNPSFETVFNTGTYDRPGVPDDWTLTRGGTSWEFALFNSATLYAEDFETGWLANEGRRTVFGGAELDEAAFDSVPEAVEDFEEEWADFIALTNDCAAQYEAHRVLTAGGVHGAPDGTNAIAVTNPATDNAEAIALANDIKAKYEAHRILIAGSVHGLADNSHVVSSPNATDWATMQTLINEIRTEYEAHRVFTTGGVHGAQDTVNDVTIPLVSADRKTEFSVGQLDDASFDSGTPEAFEDFEEEWNSNEDRRTVFGGGELDDAVFDSGTPEAVEDFEEEWSGNEGRRTVFGGGELDDASFLFGPGTVSAESFDIGPLINVPTTVAIGTELSIEPTQPHVAAFSGGISGTLELQVRRDGLATWETVDTITSVPVNIDLPVGLIALRVERTVGGTTPDAALLWQQLTDL